MRIESGKLTRKLELLAPVIVTDDFGQEISTFETVATVYAQRLDMRIVDTARAGSRDTYSLGRFLIRWRSGITTAMRVRTDGKLYDIVAVEDDDRRSMIFLTVEEAR